MAPALLTVPDLRTPGQPLRHRPVRLPVPLVEQLAKQAAAIGTSEAALVRALIARGSAEIQEALAQTPA